MVHIEKHLLKFTIYLNNFKRLFCPLLLTHLLLILFQNNIMQEHFFPFNFPLDKFPRRT